MRRGEEETEMADKVWTVRYEAGRYKDVLVEKYERTGPEKDVTYAAIQFKVQSTPKGFFKTARVTNRPKRTRIEDPNESQAGSSSRPESSMAMEEDKDPASSAREPAPDTPIMA